MPLIFCKFQNFTNVSYGSEAFVTANGRVFLSTSERAYQHVAPVGATGTAPGCADWARRAFHVVQTHEQLRGHYAPVLAGRQLDKLTEPAKARVQVLSQRTKDKNNLYTLYATEVKSISQARPSHPMSSA